jgi:hypothetical protein
VRAELATASTNERLWTTFDAAVDGPVLLALSDEERTGLLRLPERGLRLRFRFVRAVEALAFGHASSGRPREAITLFDALLQVTGLALSTYCNALWAVQDDNTHLGVDPARARRYLATCLPYGPDNPAIFFNACCALTELGDIEGALEQVRQAVLHGFDRDTMRSQIRQEAMFAPLRQDGRCFDVLEDAGPQGATLVAQVIAKVQREGWAALRLGQRAWDRGFHPLSRDLLARLTLPNGAALPPSLRAWLAFDAAWLASLGWFTLEPEFTWTPRSLGEIAAAEYGGELRGARADRGEGEEAPRSSDAEPNWAREFDVPALDQGFLLPGGSDSRRIFMLTSSADSEGEFPVLFTDIDDQPTVGVLSPGFDVWLAEKARVLSVARKESPTYTDAFADPRFAARCRHHAEVTFAGAQAVEYPATAASREGAWVDQKALPRDT